MFKLCLIAAVFVVAVNGALDKNARNAILNQHNDLRRQVANGLVKDSTG